MTAFSALNLCELVEFTDCLSAEQQRCMHTAYERIVLAGIETLLYRAERDIDYGFVDTKFNLVNGQDFDQSDTLRGKNIVFGWIQGRALEALAGHRTWLKRTSSISPCQRENIDARLHLLLIRLVKSLEEIRRRNRGRLSFAMTISGKPLQIVRCQDVMPVDQSPSAPMNFTDLFYAKGLAAAAMSLEDQEVFHAADHLFNQVACEIENGQFVSDQQQLDIENPGVKSVSGRRTYSPRMIALGATALFCKLTGNDKYREMGLRMIDHVIRHYVNIEGRMPDVRAFSLWEYIDDSGDPYIEANNVLRCLPGHATEFAGLALKHLRVCGCKEPHLQKLLTQILSVNFQNGWSSSGRGIVHTTDLNSRQVLNSNMPWWSLPETIRAVMECRHFMSDAEWHPLAGVAMRCTNAFFQYYIRPEIHGMAIQALKEDGGVAQMIPAVPDADPCYHTGLSLIDALEVLESHL